ncbi:hypothetical protein [Nannocystis pusilla]|uniref:hypothetical protein n=1 Tax=Nannocystis pusilla TaxID=889268 RepID=UPI003B7BA309
MPTMSTIQRTLLLPVTLALGCPQGGDVATQGDPSTTADAAASTATGTDVPTTGASGPGPTSSGTDATGDTGDTGDTGEPPGEPSGNALDQNALFTCDDRPALPPADLRLLDRQEWTRSVGTWSGTDLANNPLYPRAAHRYSTYSDDEALDPSVLSLYLDVVGGSGTSWTVGKWDVGRVRTVIEDPECQCFLADAAPSPECVDYFVRRYLEFGAVYRPVDDEQFVALREFAQSVLAAEAGVESRPATIKRIAAAAWMTAAALHRPELGEGQPDEHGRLRLGDWELAQAIAYALTRSPPASPASIAPTRPASPRATSTATSATSSTPPPTARSRTPRSSPLWCAPTSAASTRSAATSCSSRTTAAGGRTRASTGWPPACAPSSANGSTTAASPTSPRRSRSPRPPRGWAASSSSATRTRSAASTATRTPSSPSSTT